MTSKDFRASQVQTNKIITSGSTGTEARFLLYPIDAQLDSTPNQGQIDPVKFATGSIGQDVFGFVSGAINSLNQNTHGAFVFGGDVYISGNLVVSGVNFASGSGGGGGGGGADVSASYIVLSLTGSLPNERALVAGENISIASDSITVTVRAITTDVSASYLVLNNTASLPHERRFVAGGGVTSTDGGSNGAFYIQAPFVSASYITIGNTALLPSERALTAGPGISVVDNGAGSTVVISTIDDSSVFASISASYLVLSTTSSLPFERALNVSTGLSSSDGGAGGSFHVTAPFVSATYVTVGNTAYFPNERALTAGAGVSIIDNGAGNTIVISTLTASVYANYHDNTYGPIALYQFSGSLVDSIYGNNLSVITGSARYTELSPNLLGFSFDGSTGLATTASVLIQQITGALTVEFICNVPANNFSGSIDQYIYRMGDFGDTSGSQNSLSEISFSPIGLVNYFAEKDIGTDISYQTTNTLPFSELMHFALTRNGISGTLNYYVNGRRIDTTGSTDLPNTGSIDPSTARLQVGYYDDGTWTNAFNNFFAKNIAVCSLKIFDKELSSQEVELEFDRTLGPLYRINTQTYSSADPAATYLVVSTTSSLSNERALRSTDAIYLTDTGAGGSYRISAPFVSASYLVVTTDSASVNYLPNERYLVAGTGISMSDGGAGGSVIINATAGVGTFAPVSSAFVTIGGDSSLTNERALTAGAGVSMADGGANSTVIISTPFVSANYVTIGNTALLPNERALVASAPITLTDGGAGGNLSIGFSGETAFADVSASYIVVGLTSSLPNERRLVGAAGVAVVDQGAGGNIVVSSSFSVSSAFVMVGNIGDYPNQRGLTAGFGITITDNGAGNSVIIAVSASDIVSEPSASYLVLNNTASLPNERAFSVGTGLSSSDAGPNSSYHVSAPFVSATYITIQSEALLPNERVLSGGTGITLTDNGANNTLVIEINQSELGGAGEVSASYLVLNATSSLANERVLLVTNGLSASDSGPDGIFEISSPFVSSTFLTVTSESLLPNERYLAAGTGIGFSDAGPNGAFTISVVAAQLGDVGEVSASYLVLNATSSLANERVFSVGTGLSASDGGSGGDFHVTAPFVSATYLTLTTESNLPNERVFAVGTGLSMSDGGSNGNLTVSIVDSVVATISGSRFSGRIWASGGLTGSLQEVSPGVPYLLAGDSIALSTASNGQITISAATNIKKQYIASKRTTDSTIPFMVGQFVWVPSDFGNLTNVFARIIMSTDNTVNFTGSIQIYNLTSGSYVDIKDISGKFLYATSGTPTLITSSNLYAPGTNFNTSSTSIYEVRISGSSPNNLIFGGAELIYY